MCFCKKLDIILSHTCWNEIVTGKLLRINGCPWLWASLPKKLVETDLCAIWTEKHAPYNQFWPRKNQNVTKLKFYCPNIYTVDWKQIRSETQCENHAKTHSICVWQKNLDETWFICNKVDYSKVKNKHVYALIFCWKQVPCN